MPRSPQTSKQDTRSTAPSKSIRYYTRLTPRVTLRHECIHKVRAVPSFSSIKFEGRAMTIPYK
ncbi:hypothetical protein AGABI1DRAFT_113777 [Agaricus bisporus var. burnettii JB137-S8]|uniref:Uncharacterized protein n=1 Tax=Agaricus bisporus var. burnettii (strain JB137-S8 / ATCC MYA-4627 / FGSC 10392) TaxID=597362 RepID=K5WUQ7_AGABU|nr:uncharacterized protein AGABI1DRAFT_113777 [Agaricus bisporus var. burnettii JB137-S8]EKM79176.1 hypothetical protein AGABI1DRAFT_113777 [Agaricus bisporus var. burnettii JB137-S8]